MLASEMNRRQNHRRSLSLIVGPQLTAPAKNDKAKPLSEIRTMADSLGEDQAALLEAALQAVRIHTGSMRKCLETPGKLMDALKCA